MIEFTLLEVVLLVALAVFVYLYFTLSTKYIAYRNTTAIMLLGIHRGQLKTVEDDDTITIKPV
jgi:hypothetical protein